MSEPRGCRFVLGYGECGKPIAESSPYYCAEHAATKCRCGRSADHICGNASSLTCGQPLCSWHECLGTTPGPHSYQAELLLVARGDRQPKDGDELQIAITAALAESKRRGIERALNVDTMDDPGDFAPSDVDYCDGWDVGVASKERAIRALLEEGK